MLLPENLPISHSIGLVIAVSATVFAWRFYIFRKNSLASLYSLPSILVTGPKLSGKTSLIKTITKSEISMHPFEYSLQLGYLKNENQTLQFIEVPSFVNRKIDNLQRFKKMNLKSIIYLFDVSKNSDTIESQLENFEITRNFFKGIPFLIVANKIDLAGKDSVEKLESKFEKIYEISSLDKGLIKPEDSLLLKREFEDLTRLIQDFSHETVAQKEVRSLT